MHTIGEIDIHVPCAFEHRVITIGATLKGMTCLVYLVIGFGLNNTDTDQSSINLTDQIAAQ